MTKQEIKNMPAKELEQRINLWEIALRTDTTFTPKKRVKVEKELAKMQRALANKGLLA